MLNKAETTALSSISESKRQFKELDEFISSMNSTEAVVANIKVIEAKMGLQMDVEFPGKLLYQGYLRCSVHNNRFCFKKLPLFWRID